MLLDGHFGDVQILRDAKSGHSLKKGPFQQQYFYEQLEKDFMKRNPTLALRNIQINPFQLSDKKLCLYEAYFSENRQFVIIINSRR